MVDKYSQIAAANMKRLRMEHGLTQPQLADAIGVSRSMIAQLEAGKTGMRAETLIAAARVFGIEPGVLASPGGAHTAPIGPIVDAYLGSPYAQIDKPTPEEIVWLRESGVITTLGREASPKTLSLLLEARRSIREV